MYEFTPVETEYVCHILNDAATGAYLMFRKHVDSSYITVREQNVSYQVPTLNIPCNVLEEIINKFKTYLPNIIASSNNCLVWEQYPTDNGIIEFHCHLPVYVIPMHKEFSIVYPFRWNTNSAPYCVITNLSVLDPRFTSYMNNLETTTDEICLSIARGPNGEPSGLDAFISTLEKFL